jgi:glycosyltransferase involved in cell wall biosynthesis
MLTGEMKRRIHFLGWRGSDYLRGLSLAEVVIDTFPSGGGGVLLDALALGIPCVSFENNYMRLYDQTEWSLADEFILIPELKVPRGDFAELKRVVARLIENPEYRREIARRSTEYVLATRTDAVQSIRDCEKIYLGYLEERLQGEPSPDSLVTEIVKVSRQAARSQSKRSLVSYSAYQHKRVLKFASG